MASSKQRMLWSEMPSTVHSTIEGLVDGRVLAADSCEGGYSPGFASRLTLADGRMVFVKAMDLEAWPSQAAFPRAEIQVASMLPESVPAPRFLGSYDDANWVILAFEGIAGHEPAQPWRADELERTVDAAVSFAEANTAPPVNLRRDHPRLGGLAALATDRYRLAQLPAHSKWVTANLPMLIELESQGLAAAQGSALVHFDMLPHNIMLTADKILFVDWPHARVGAPFIDVLMLLSTAAASGIDPEPIISAHALTANLDANIVDAFLAAHGGFLLADALFPVDPGLEPITDAKLRLGRATLSWLQSRIARRDRTR